MGFEAAGFLGLSILVVATPVGAAPVQWLFSPRLFLIGFGHGRTSRSCFATPRAFITGQVEQFETPTWRTLPARISRAPSLPGAGRSRSAVPSVDAPQIFSGGTFLTGSNGQQSMIRRKIDHQNDRPVGRDRL
jgi:hypothetical protein